MGYQRQHAFVHESFDNDQIEMFSAGHQLVEHLVSVARLTGGSHPFRMLQPQLDRIVSVKANFVSAVQLLQSGRVQVSDISYIFPWLQAVPVSNCVSTTSQCLDRVEEEMRVTVGGDGR